MIGRKPAILLSLFSLLALLAGCAPVGGLVVSERDMPPPEALLDRLGADDAPGKVLIGILHVTASLPRERHTLKIAAAAMRPDRLRLEDISVIGLPDFMLAVRGEEIRMFLPRSGEFLIGTESSEEIRRVLPPPLRPLDLVALLYGQPPGVPGAKTLKGSVDGNRFRVDVYAGGRWAQSLWVDPASGRLARIEIAGRDGGTAYAAQFHDFTDVGSIAVPGRIEIETSGLAAVRLSLRNTAPELAERDDDRDLFLLTPPEGVTPRAAR
ncbi:MAG: DUF4292 domain-containing protein [Syntrophaceae bacterium]|nr:DUF4292 domain-containing protein [Syntrophaceae bacterium]